ARSETNGISLASIKLPLLRLEDGQKAVLCTHESYSRLAVGTAHRAALQLVCLVGRHDCPRARGDRLVFCRPKLALCGFCGQRHSATCERRRLRRRRFTHIALANAASPVSCENIKMDMVVVMAVSAGSQHSRKSMAGGLSHIITKRF